MSERPEILKEREKSHGSFKEQAALWLKLGSVGYDSRLCPAQRLALTMIYVKISRLLQGDPMCKDHWYDIAGYAQLGAEACQKT